MKRLAGFVRAEAVQHPAGPARGRLHKLFEAFFEPHLVAFDGLRAKRCDPDRGLSPGGIKNAEIVT
jgi:hypothetical protein